MSMAEQKCRDRHPNSHRPVSLGHVGSELDSQSVNLMALYQLIKKLGQTLIINVFPFVKSTRGIRLRLWSSPKKSQKTQATFSKGRSPETKIMLVGKFSS